ncbi:uncharacterized protein BDR25DRAFT_306918 [Lindgomyces ingoldianus]|uniref:Uncharacterized protein n=1 Tax=Lindgomyces ingoldianus TaxID=673940 RepID=A0ACB6QDX0_9PLEO|nr:uncharacterized protein BDR25DRAFT_306918 [Lindgomyces ingoldianus]KAF2465092.1 hypothetical protein BDR25DRAFT_306918 [Lindgomyces ingoldianus]
MQIPILFLALLATFTTAQNACTGDKSQAGYCTALTYVDRTTSVTGPPTVTECLDTCRGVLSEAGDWQIDFRGQPASYVQVMMGYPCEFAVSRPASEPQYVTAVHNQDIIDIIDEVNKRFGGLHAGKVAATGTMNCGGHIANWYVD